MAKLRHSTLRRALVYFRQDLLSTLFSFGLLASKIGLDLVAPWPIKLIVDGVLSPQGTAGTESSRRFLADWLGWAGTPMVTVLILCLAMVSITLAASALQILFASLTLRVGLRAVLHLRTQLYETLQSLPLRFHDQFPSADASFRLAYDTQAIQSVYSQGVIPFTQSLLMLVGVAWVMLRLNAQMAAVSLLVVPPVVWTVQRYTRKIESQSRVIREHESRLLGSAQEGMSSVRVVQVFGRERSHLDRFRRHAEAALRSTYLMNTTQVRSSLVVNGLTTSGTAVIYAIGALQVLSGKLSIGGLIVFMTYLAQLYTPMESLSASIWAFSGAAASLKRSFEILDRRSEALDAPCSRPLRVDQAVIRFEDVSFGYDRSHPVFRHLDLHVRPGETLALVGQTGGGKTSLLGLLARFYEPDRGRILIDDQDLAGCTRSSIRQSMSVVLQDTLLFSATLAENISYGREGATRREIEQAAKAAQAYDFIMALPKGFDTYVGERGGHLSGGQRQRIAIARAFLKDAPILLLDEPTSALDAGTERAILESITRLMNGRTTILVTHRLALTERATRVAVLKEGRISEIDSPASLVAKGGDFAKLLRG